MRVESFNGDKERDVLASIIYDTDVLSAVSVTYQGHNTLFRSSIPNGILSWVVNYFGTYKKAPGKDVSNYVDGLIDTNPDYAQEVRSYLSTIKKPSSENSALLLDNADKYFAKVQVEQFSNKLQSTLVRGDVDGCHDLITNFHRVETGAGHGVNPITDDEAISQAYRDKFTGSLIPFEDDGARRFFGDTFSRSSFVVINAAEKAGKSSLMLEIAVRAVWNGRNVAYFEAGDMSQDQVLRRLHQRIANHPRRAGTVRIPSSLMMTEGVVEVIWRENRNGDTYFTFSEDMDEKIARNGLEKWKVRRQKHLAEMGKECDVNDVGWRFSAHPQDLSVQKIESILDEWERVDNFLPDFVIIDYADLLVSSLKTEYRHQINDTFARLRGLSLAKKCCVLTATQANGKTNNTEIMTRANLAEDKRKAAHPTAMLGLLSSQSLRERQLAKLNYLVRRDDACFETDTLYLGQCLEMCAPMVATVFSEHTTTDSDVDDDFDNFDNPSVNNRTEGSDSVDIEEYTSR